MKRALVLLATAAFVSAVPASSSLAAQPQADTVDTRVPTQLPRTAVPHHYAITLTPHADRLVFNSTVAIDLDVVQPTRTLVLNAADLKLASATLTPAKGGAALTARIALDEQAQTATLTFPSELTNGAYRLDIRYSGKINTQANGLFALDYKNKEGKDARSLFTQFEAADARRFVPSWDEPDYKATWDLTAHVPANEMAVSNMPITSSKPVAGGLKEVRFQTSPIMSSYLLFFAQGDFDRISRKVGDKEVGIVVSRGNGQKAQFALDAEAQILPYYDDYFGTPYPLPKLDNVGGPGESQFFGAMENWGAIFTFERILLNDPAITSEGERQAIFGVEAHEMAHQWFGDLVTMAWWDDLWLNEGFASWMASKATRHFYPEWDADIESVSAREQAMGLDAFKSTHPIVQEIRTVEQTNQAFDTITYEKGESVLGMLEVFAGADVWRAGLRDYMARHAYQNTRTSDLWAAMERAGAKGLATIARDYITQPGIPLIQVGASHCAGGQTVATVTQSQFSADQKAEVAANPGRWHVPVRASAGGAVSQVLTDGPTAQITAPGCGPLLINPGQTGYYRVNYTAQQLQALQGAFTKLAAVDQYGLINDQMALAVAAYQPMGAGLNLVAQVPGTANAKVVQSALSVWSGQYDNFEQDKATQSAIAARVSRLYGPRLQQLGFAPRQGELATDALLRGSLIGTLGKMRDPAVVAEARRLFAAWQSNPDAIPGSLKQTWLRVIARNADEATWEALHAKAKAATGAVERTSLYQLLGATADAKLAGRALDLALTNEPGKTISAGMITSVAGGHQRLAVDFVLAHLAQVNQLIDISGRSRFMQRLVGGSSDAKLIPTLEAYAKANLAATDRKPIDQAIDRIRFQASTLPRIRSEVAAWIKANPA